MTLKERLCIIILQQYFVANGAFAKNPAYSWQRLKAVTITSSVMYVCFAKGRIKNVFFSFGVSIFKYVQYGVSKIHQVDTHLSKADQIRSSKSTKSKDTHARTNWWHNTPCTTCTAKTQLLQAAKLVQLGKFQNLSIYILCYYNSISYWNGVVLSFFLKKFTLRKSQNFACGSIFRRVISDKDVICLVEMPSDLDCTMRWMKYGPLVKLSARTRQRNWCTPEQYWKRCALNFVVCGDNQATVYQMFKTNFKCSTSKSVNVLLVLRVSRGLIFSCRSKVSVSWEAWNVLSVCLRWVKPTRWTFMTNWGFFNWQVGKTQMNRALHSSRCVGTALGPGSKFGSLAPWSDFWWRFHCRAVQGSDLGSL